MEVKLGDQVGSRARLVAKIQRWTFAFASLVFLSGKFLGQNYYFLEQNNSFSRIFENTLSWLFLNVLSGKFLQ
jgi:hypothetical protein